MTAYDQALRIMKSPEPDVGKAYALLKKAEGKGDVKATYALATWYIYGKEPLIKKNMRIATEKLRVAVDGRNTDAAYDLARCYEVGAGVRKSLKKAFELYMLGAVWGDEKACFEVGRCFGHGIGIARNDELMKIWVDRAAYLGLNIEAEMRR